MAVWQLELALQPNVSRAVQRSVEDEHIEARSGTLFQRSDADVIRAIDGILPRRDSWSEDLLCWGEESGNRIHVRVEAGKIEGITARIDLRHPCSAFIDELIGIARDYDAHFRAEDESDVPADKARMLGAIRHPDAFQFVMSPRRYLDGLQTD